MADAKTENMKSIARFNKQINVATKRMAVDMPRMIQRRVALDALSRLIFRTPVGNSDLWKIKPKERYVGGRARANWQVDIGSIPSSINETEDRDGSATLSSGSSKITKANGFDTVYIANNVEYIVALEEGHSTQAPQGMMALTVAELEMIQFPENNEVIK